jgi:hypothetical protein
MDSGTTSKAGIVIEGITELVVIPLVQNSVDSQAEYRMLYEVVKPVDDVPAWQHISNETHREQFIKQTVAYMYVPNTLLSYIYSNREDRYKNYTRRQFTEEVLLPQLERGLINARMADQIEVCRQPVPGPSR